jgi:poly-gamma-glutamate capsule biosynthesis protein CapA/YwtB (metallophosphatase superfamily)
MRRLISFLLLGLFLSTLPACAGRPNQPTPTAEVQGQLETPSPEITLLAVGDVNLGRKAGRIILAGDVDYAFEKTADIIGSADIAFANLESTISEQNGTTQNGTWCFTAPPIAAETLSHAGFDVVSLSNNHVWDFGKRALLETPTHLDRVGIRHAGTGENLEAAFSPAILEAKGIRIALFSVTNIFNFGGPEHEAFTYTAWADMGRLAPAIKKVKDDVDLVVVAAHWGAEYQDRPADETVALAHEMVDAGADIVLGGHPHVPQGIERYKGAFIIYSLGNFAYHQTTEHSVWKTRSIMLLLTLTKDGVKSYRMIPVTCGFQPAVAECPLADEILAHMEKISGYLGGSEEEADKSVR